MHVVYRKIKKLHFFTFFIGFSMHLSSLAQNRASGVVRVFVRDRKSHLDVKHHPTCLTGVDAVEAIDDDVGVDIDTDWMFFV